MVVLGGGAVSYERGSLVVVSFERGTPVVVSMLRLTASLWSFGRVGGGRYVGTDSSLPRYSPLAHTRQPAVHNLIAQARNLRPRRELSNRPNGSGVDWSLSLGTCLSGQRPCLTPTRVGLQQRSYPVEYV